MIAQFACVYIKREFVQNDEGLSREGFDSMRDQLFGFVDFSRPQAYLQSLAFLIVKVYAKLEQFENLLEKTGEWGQHKEAKARSFAMSLIEVLADVHLPVELFKKYIQQFATIFQNGLNDATTEVKVSTLKATSSFLTSLQEKGDVKEFAPIIQPMIETIITAMKEDETIGRKSLESMIQLSEFHPHLFETYITQIITIVAQIMNTPEFEADTRSIASEFVCSIADSYPALLRKTDGVKSEFFPALFKMMCECELAEDDEQVEWSNRIEADELSKTDVHSCAKLSLARFAKSIGEKTTIAATTELLKASIVDGNWKVRHAGYFFLGYLAEACKTSFAENLDEIMRMAASGCVDPHPRVKYAGLTCLGLMLQEQAPKAQKKFHAEILPQLMTIMDQDELFKIKATATSAAINFVRELITVDENNIEEMKKDKGTLGPYISQLMQICGKLLEASLDNPYTPLQEEVLALVSCIAQLIEGDFADYYASFMPGLKHILQNTGNETSAKRDLKANTIQCIGFLMEAVKERASEFSEDAKTVTDAFVSLLAPGVLSEDDPQILSITNALTQVSCVLQEEFLPFMPAIMEKLLKDAQGDVDFKLEDADIEALTQQSDNSAAGVTSITLAMKGLEGQKKLSLNTNALENKINAVHVIKELARNLGKNFFNFVDQTWNVLRELFEYRYSKAVRDAVRECCANMITCCPDEATMSALFNAFYPAFKGYSAHLCNKGEAVELVEILNGLLHCIRPFKTGSYLELPEVQVFTEFLGKCSALCQAEKEVRKKNFEEDKPTLDEEDYAEFEEIIDDIEKLNTNVMEISGEFMKHYKEPVTEMIKTHLVPHFAILLNKADAIEPEIIDACCFFIDVLENLSMDIFNELYLDVTKKFFELFDAKRQE